MSDDLLTIGDVRKAGYCVRGSRRWCIDNNVDFKQLCKGGIPVVELEVIDDVILQDVIKKKREASNGR